LFSLFALIPPTFAAAINYKSGLFFLKIKNFFDLLNQAVFFLIKNFYNFSSFNFLNIADPTIPLCPAK
jgi:hypothetical protein